LQECFGTLLNPKKSLVNDFEHKFNLSCEIAGQEKSLGNPHFFQKIGLKVRNLGFISFVINKISRPLYGNTQLDLKDGVLRSD
jgi:hypothetical protein